MKFSNASYFGSLLLSLTLCCCNKKELTHDDQGDKTDEFALKTGSAGKNHPELHASLAKLPGQNALSQRCQECHKDIHHHWQKSDHGQANRLIDLALDSEPFANQTFDGVEKWNFTKEGNKPTVTANGKDHSVGMAIGIKPLVQYLVCCQWRSLADPECRLGSSPERMVRHLQWGRAHRGRLGPLDRPRHGLEHPVRMVPHDGLP